MGITSLDTICGIYSSKFSLYKLRNSTVCVDIFELIYRSKINGGSSVSGIFNFIEKLLKNNIAPVFVFDGKPPDEKKGGFKKAF